METLRIGFIGAGELSVSGISRLAPAPGIIFAAVEPQPRVGREGGKRAWDRESI